MFYALSTTKQKAFFLFASLNICIWYNKGGAPPSQTCGNHVVFVYIVILIYRNRPHKQSVWKMITYAWFHLKQNKFTWSKCVSDSGTTPFSFLMLMHKTRKRKKANPFLVYWFFAFKQWRAMKRCNWFVLLKAR